MSGARPSDLALSDLNKTVSCLWDYAVSKRTSSTYDSAVRTFQTFLLMNNLVQTTDPLPHVSEDIFLLYIAHCFKTLQLQYSTIKLYLCGLRFAYIKTGIPCPLVRDNNSNLRIITLLNAVKRIQGQSRRVRHPITASILKQLCSVLHKGYISNYTDSLLHCACVVAFFGFLRCGEFTLTHCEFNPTTHLCLEDLKLFATHAELHLKASKTDPFRHGITIKLYKLNSLSILCPYRSLQCYLKMRNEKFQLQTTSTDPLFLTEEGKPLNRTYFMSHVGHILHQLGFNSNYYSGHSFRIGAASSACSARLEDHLIKTLGRWSSDCYRTYIHTPHHVLQEAQSALLKDITN